MHITRGKILAVSKFVSSSKRLPPAYSANTKACIPPSQGERKSCSSQRPTYRRILSARVASPCCLQRKPFCKQAALRGGDYNRAPPCLLSPRVFLARSIYPSPSSSLGNRAIDPCSLPKIFQVSNKFFRRSV